jgi:hypothetical protein
MNAKNKNLRWILPLLIVFLLMACNLPTGLTGTPASVTAAPAESTSEISSIISAAMTQAVDTVLQSLTQTAMSNPPSTVTLRPTSTTDITASPVASFTPPPTVTPKPPATNTPQQPIAPIVVATKAPVATSTQGPFQCSIKSLSPKYNQAVTKGVDFDLNVTLKNIGTETWDSGSIDFSYASGVKMQTSVDALDLNSDVDPGDTVSFVVDMVAPNNTGTQAARWILGDFCTVYFSVYVKP